MKVSQGAVLKKIPKGDLSTVSPLREVPSTADAIGLTVPLLSYKQQGQS